MTIPNDKVEKDKYYKNNYGIKYGHTGGSIVEKKLYVKDSGDGRGMGLFAGEDIPKGVIIKDSMKFSDKINDLAYRGNASQYYAENNVESYVNVIFRCTASELEIGLFGMDFCQDSIFLETIKDIKKDEELSRTYGMDYWLENEFLKKYSNAKFWTTMNDEDLLPEFVFIDKMKTNLESKQRTNLFGKKEGNKFYYKIGLSTQIRCGFTQDKINEWVDVTKPDNSMYKFDEPIIFQDNLLYRVKYLTT